MKKVLVTGATGFIGKWVVRELIRQDIEVIAIIREGSSEHDALAGYDVRVVACNLGNYNRLPELIEDRDVDTVYHFAWQGVSDADCRNSDIQLDNVRATLELLDAMETMHIKTFIGAGSLHEAEAIQEMSEDKTITNLGYMYKAAKTCAHWMAKAKAGAASIRFFWPVITNAYGEGESSGRLINTVIRKILAGESPALSEGKQLYDFVHISDVARAFYLIGDKGVEGNNYVIGSGESKPLREFLIQVGEIANMLWSGDPVPLGFGKIQSNVALLPIKVFAIDRLTKDTGFAPKVHFADGVKRTAEWISQTSKFASFVNGKLM